MATICVHEFTKAWFKFKMEKEGWNVVENFLVKKKGFSTSVGARLLVEFGFCESIKFDTT
jgi:hypothetical protein